MNNKNLMSIRQRAGKRSLLVLSVISLAVGCNKPHPGHEGLKDFKQVNLVANTSEYNPVTVDPTLLNGFGLAWSPNGVAWVNSVGGHVSEVYTADGMIARTGVNIPSPLGAGGGFPCGIVFSGGKGFNQSNGTSSFLFTGFDGVLSGWNPASGDTAKRLKGPFTEQTSYTGLAIAASQGRNLIYAANFGEKKVNVWDTAFAPVAMSFNDPYLPADYSPYNIQAVGDLLFVIYAKLGADGHGVAGTGNGFVSVFKTDGSFVKRFASRGTLNIPWGVTMAPGSFFEQQQGDDVTNNNNAHNGDHNPNEPVMLIGNFGDGHINVYDLDGRFLGQLRSKHSNIVIDGLWALSFAPSTATNVDPARLYFTAGPDHEADGLFGYLIKQ